jgi:hypothetical protein
MNEKKILRTYTSRTFIGDESKQVQIYSKPIHYLNHQERGDGKKGLRVISKEWVEDGDKFRYEFSNDPFEAPKRSSGYFIYKDEFFQRNVEFKITPIGDYNYGSIDGYDLVYPRVFEGEHSLVVTPTQLGVQFKALFESDFPTEDIKIKYEVKFQDDVKLFEIDGEDFYEFELDKTTLTLDDFTRKIVIGKEHFDSTILKTPISEVDEGNQSNLVSRLVWSGLGYDLEIDVPVSTFSEVEEKVEIIQEIAFL